MKYNELNLMKKKSAIRPGRGISGGRGKTAGRGTKGQGARKSGGVRPGFEGGQMPLYMRLPKLRGFKSRRPKSETVFTSQLNVIKKSVIDTAVLAEVNLITSPYTKVKLLFDEELATKKDVKLPGASKSAADAITKGGGSFTRVDQFPRPATKSDKA